MLNSEVAQGITPGNVCFKLPNAIWLTCRRQFVIAPNIKDKNHIVIGLSTHVYLQLEVMDNQL